MQICPGQNRDLAPPCVSVALTSGPCPPRREGPCQHELIPRDCKQLTWLPTFSQQTNQSRARTPTASFTVL